ncbi:MAG: DUF5675 family protein [Porphyromonadaceae bacterium]|nr:DUF5675 family protein [Porphyromonadaceae bacterium]
MKLDLIRKEFTEISTIGELLIDGIFYCYTLEDMYREKKIKGVTAIPYGKYEVIINFSNRFQKQMPLLLNVKGFEGIRIHSLNTSDQTAGCIGVGFVKGINYIGQSRKAFNELMPILRKALKTGKVFIEITREPIIGA